MSSAFIEISFICISCDTDKTLLREIIGEEIIRWWNEDRKHLDENIRKDIKTYKQMKSSGRSGDELEKDLRHISLNYGIFSLPYLMPEIEKGNHDFAPVVWDMIYKLDMSEEKKSEVENMKKNKVSDKKKMSEIIIDAAKTNAGRLDEIKKLIPDYMSQKETSIEK